MHPKMALRGYTRVTLGQFAGNYRSGIKGRADKNPLFRTSMQGSAAELITRRPGSCAVERRLRRPTPNRARPELRLLPAVSLSAALGLLFRWVLQSLSSPRLRPGFASPLAKPCSRVVLEATIVALQRNRARLPGNKLSLILLRRFQKREDAMARIICSGTGTAD